MIRLFLSRLFQDPGAWGLPVAAFGMTSAVAFMVAGGSRYFFTLRDRFPDSGFIEHYAQFYGFLAGVALVLLVVPMVSLMRSAASLMARRRDQRLSSLRLLGAKTSQLRGLAVAEAAALSLTGILAGAGLYVALMPLVGLIPFAGQPMGVRGVWLGPGLLFIVACALFLLAVLSSLSGMRRIDVTPLGVRTRTEAGKARWIRLAAGAGAVVVINTAAHGLNLGSEAVAITLLFMAVLVPLAAVQFVGPWVLKVLTSLQLRRAKTAVRLIAARNVLESPQQMWRQIGGVSVTTYAGVIAGCGIGLVLRVDGAASLSSEDMILFGDIQRGVWLTLAVSFVMAAVSVGIHQTAQILDRRELYVSLLKMGMEPRQLDAVRRFSVMGSLGIVLTVVLVMAAVTALPIIGSAVVMAPGTVLTALFVVLGGVGVVYIGVLLTGPTLRRTVGEEVSTC